MLDQADKLLGSRQWSKAIEKLESIRDNPLSRPLLVKALSELADDRLTIATLWPPLTNVEIVMLGGAILENGTREEAEMFVQLELVAQGGDASVREISRRIHERRLK